MNRSKDEIIERVITVEYLDPSMAHDLLCKFPDESTFDFDYTQSGIWSPLVPRKHYAVSSSSIEKLRKLAAGSEKVPAGKSNKSNVKIKMKNLKKKKKKSSEISATPLQVSSPRKGWGRVLRAASKRFKKQKGTPLQIKLPML